MNKVLLVSVFGGGLGNNRQNNILYRQRENTVLITSDFNHEKKRYKTKSEMENSICLHVPSYMKNLSLKRIYSHIIFAYH